MLTIAFSALAYLAFPFPAVALLLGAQAPVIAVLHILTRRALNRWPWGATTPVRTWTHRIRARVDEVEQSRARKARTGRDPLHAAIRLSIFTLPVLFFASAMGGDAVDAKMFLGITAAWLLPVGLSAFIFFALVVFIGAAFFREYQFRAGLKRVISTVGYGSGLAMILAVCSVGLSAVTSAEPSTFPARSSILLLPVMVNSLTVGALLGGLVGLAGELSKVATAGADTLAGFVDGAMPWSGVAAIRAVWLPTAMLILGPAVMPADRGLAPGALAAATQPEILTWALVDAATREGMPLDPAVNLVAAEMTTSVPTWSTALICYAIVGFLAGLKAACDAYGQADRTDTSGRGSSGSPALERHSSST